MEKYVGMTVPGTRDDMFKFLGGTFEKINFQTNSVFGDELLKIYQLGWSSYCFFTSNGISFDNLAVNGRRVTDDTGAASEYSQIVTRSVSSCTLIVIKCGNMFFFMHMDALNPNREEELDRISVQVTELLNEQTDNDVYFFASYGMFKSNSGERIVNILTSSIDNCRNKNIHLTNIIRCTADEIDRGSINGIKVHVEVGIAFNDREPIIYGDFYNDMTARHVGDFTYGFAEGNYTEVVFDDDIYNGGCCGGCIVC